MSNLAISHDLLSKIVSHCKYVYPNEACGILAGKNCLTEKVYEITNIENSSVSYFMDSGEQLRVMKQLRNEGNEMLAIYHSHPNFPAYPSVKDVSLAFYPDAIYLIVSLSRKDAPEIKAYEIVDRHVKEITIEVINKK